MRVGGAEKAMEELLHWLEERDRFAPQRMPKMHSIDDGVSGVTNTLESAGLKAALRSFAQPSGIPVWMIDVGRMIGRLEVGLRKVLWAWGCAVH